MLTPLGGTWRCDNCLGQDHDEPVFISKETTSIAVYRNQPYFQHLVTTCHRCHLYINLPPFVGVKRAQELGCPEATFGNYAPDEMVERYQYENDREVLTIRPLSDADEKRVLFFRCLVSESRRICDELLGEPLANSIS